MNEANKENTEQSAKAFTGAAAKFVGVIVLVIAIYYAAQWASYTFFSAVG